MSIYAAQFQPFSLAGGGAVIGDTSITLKSMKDINGNAISMSTAFGSKGYATLEPGNSSLEEQISFTGLTNNSNGTTTLTGVSSVLFQEPYTETSGLSKTHAGSTTLVISNTSAFASSFANKNNAEVITQNWQVPDPIGMTDIANKEYVLSVVSGGTVSVDKVIVAGNAGETVSAGQVLYLKTDGKWWKADASATASSVNVLLGIAQGAGTAGNAITGGVLIQGLDANQGGISSGSAYYLTNTPGTISTTPGTNVVQIGTGSASATKLYFQTVVGAVSIASVSSTSKANAVIKADSNGFINNGFIGNLLTADIDQSQTTSDSTYVVGEVNATTKHAKIAQKFIPTVPSIRGAYLWKIADTGTFTGTVTISLQADSSGSPSGSALATVTLSNAAWLKLANAAEFGVMFASEYSSMVVGNPYWIVVETSTNDNSNHPNIGANSAGGYASGALKYYNGTDGWTLTPTTMLYFKTQEGIITKIVETDTNGLIPTAIRPYSVVDMTALATSVNGSTTETTAYSKQLEGGFFKSNTGIRVRPTFDVRWNSGVTNYATFKLYFNDQLIGTATSGTVGGGGSSYATEVMCLPEFLILNSGSTSAQNLGLNVQNVILAGGSVSAANIVAATTSYQNWTTSTLDLSIPGTLKLTMALNGATDTYCYARGIIVEKIG